MELDEDMETIVVTVTTPEGVERFTRSFAAIEDDVRAIEAVKGGPVLFNWGTTREVEAFVAWRAAREAAAAEGRILPAFDVWLNEIVDVNVGIERDSVGITLRMEKA